MLMTHPLRIAMGLLLALAAAAPAQDQPQAVSLQPKFTAGRVSRYEMWTFRKQEVIMSLGPRSQTTSNRMEVRGEITWTVNDVADDGSATCTMTMDWMKVTLIGNDGKQQTNDSRQGSGDNEKVFTLISAMTGVPLTVSVAPDGSISDIDGIGAIHSAVADDIKVPDDLDFIETASDLAVISQAPAEAEAGESFPATFNWTHDMGMMRHNGEYTLAQVETIADIPIATVNGRFDLSLDADPSKLSVPDEGPAVDISFNGGKVESQIMFDLVRGEAVGRNTVQTNSITLTMQVRDQTLTRTVNEMVQSQALRIAE